MNTQQLVIRCDTSNSYYKVGWASELPLGRFQHIELLSESDTHITLTLSNPVYKKACSKVSDLNKSLIVRERNDNRLLGWHSVGLNLDDTSIKVLADEFGCFNNLAAKTRYRLSKNCSQVWAVFKNNEVVQIEARYPERKMAEFEYQIWTNHQLNKLKQYGSDIKQGKLLVCFSGLWFSEQDSVFK